MRNTENRKLVVRTYFGKRDERTNQERIVARDSETGKVILFDRNDPMTGALVPEKLFEAEIMQETDTFFIARAIRAVTSPELGAEEASQMPKNHRIGFENHIIGFESSIAIAALHDIGVNDLYLPIPDYLAPALRKFARKRIRVEVYST